MKKKLTALILALVMCLGLVPAASAAEAPTGFTDVPSNAWYIDAVRYVTDAGLFNGTSDTTFSPNLSMTRGMFVTVLANMAGVDAATIIDDGKFTDNDFGSWYGRFVVWAAENGYVNGTTATTFAPNAPITREQIAVILYNFMRRLDVDLPNRDVTAFKDADTVSAWAKTGVSAMREWGFVNGDTEGNYAPLRNISRAEAAQILMGVHKFLTNYSDAVGVTLNSTSKTMNTGDSLQLEAYTAPRGVSDDVTWASANASVATVDENGLVTALRSGNASISATTSSGLTSFCYITATGKATSGSTGSTGSTGSQGSGGSQGDTGAENPPAPPAPVAAAAVRLNQETAALKVGDTLKLNVTVLPVETTDKTVKWTTDGETIASVASDGTITAKGEGVANITAACGDASAVCSVIVTTEAPQAVPVSTVTMSTKNASMKVGDKLELSADVAPANATNQYITWTSSNNKATVGQDGIVTAVGTGSVVITAAAGGRSDTCSITIAPADVPVESVKLDKETANMVKGGSTLKLTAAVNPGNATDKDVVWGTDSPQVATVENGVVTAKGAGIAHITASAGGKSATCTVTVTVNVDSVTLDQQTVTIQQGETLDLHATVAPVDATSKTVTWSSKASSIAEVDQDGKVTAKGIGQTTITATAGGKSATCTVNVEAKVVPVSSIELSQKNVVMTEGDSNVTLTADVEPNKATNKTVTWTSSDAGTVEVNGGKLTAKKAGSARITATAGNMSAVCEVTVKAKEVLATGVKLSQNTAQLEAGDTMTLTATVQPAAATDKTVSWSADGDVSVQDNGNGSATVTANTAGSGTVTVTANGHTDKCTITVLAKNNATWTAADIVIPNNSFNVAVNGPFVKGDRRVMPTGCGHTLMSGKNYTIQEWLGGQYHFHFESSDESIIKVDHNTGELYDPILLTNKDPDKVAYITVTHTPGGVSDGTSRRVKVTIKGNTYYDIDDEYIADFAAELLRLANAERDKDGVDPLEYDARYQACVNARAKELEIIDGHSRPNGETTKELQEDFGLAYKFTRENTYSSKAFSHIGQMTNVSPVTLAGSVFKEYMNDFGHSSTITGDGIKYMVTGLYVNNGAVYSILWISTKDI